MLRWEKCIRLLFDETIMPAFMLGLCQGTVMFRACGCVEKLGIVIWFAGNSISLKFIRTTYSNFAVSQQHSDSDANRDSCPRE